RARQRAEAAADAGEADAEGLLRAALQPGQPRAAERDAGDEDGDVRGSDPRVPAPRLRAVADQAGPRLVGRAAVRALHPGEERVRDPVSPDAAVLSRRGRRLRVSGSVLPDLRPRLHAAGL